MKFPLPFYFRFFFFFLLLIAGLCVFKDYGVHTDEYFNQSIGEEALRYVLASPFIHAVAPLKSESSVQTHGAIVEMSLKFVQRVFKVRDTREVLLLRHFCCFLLFLMGVYFFWSLCEHYFNSWKMGLLGSLFLAASPRIFANAFYDTYDIPLLSFYIISIYTLLRWLRRKTFINAFLHALSCAILFDTRAIGLVMPLFTSLIFLIDTLNSFPIQQRIKIFRQFLLYLCLLSALIVIGWPLLWSNPLMHFLEVIKGNVGYRFPFGTTILFMGRDLMQYRLPWYYVPVWILITTPVIYSLYFLVGVYFSVILLFSRQLFIKKRGVVLFLLCFLTPQLLAQGKLYDTWRHLFFIYPAFLMISLIGLSALWEKIKDHFSRPTNLILQGLLILVTAGNLCGVLGFMVKYHPFQFVYFNRLAGKDMQEIKKRYILDYWGLPYKQALEDILKKDTEKIIPICPGDEISEFISNNINILQEQDRRRFQLTDIDNAKYLITNYIWHPKEYPYPLYDAIKIGNANILGIYKLK